MDNFGCKMSKITKTMKKGLQLWVQEVMWAGTQCSDFFPQARLILCQYINNFAALCLNPLYVLNILISTAWKSVIADMPLSGVYNQEMAAIRVGVKYNWSSTQILQVLVIKYKYFAFSPIKYSSTSSTDTPSTSTSVNIGWLIYTGNTRVVIPLKYRPVQ